MVSVFLPPSSLSSSPLPRSPSLAVFLPPPSHVTHSTSHELTNLAVGRLLTNEGNIRKTDGRSVFFRPFN